jgi:putative peptidoglycan lipid II flippase
LVRDILIASVVGTGPVADAFIVAFKLPNLFRRLFGEGAFNAAFVPLFARRLEQGGEAAAKAFAEQALALLLTSLLALSAAAMAGMPWVVHLLAPGFAADPEKFALTVELSRITFPYLLFMALAALLSGVLNSLYRFAAAAAAPILLNIFFIAALVGVVPLTGQPGHVLAWTVAAAGAGQFLMLHLAAARAGMRLCLPRPRLTPAMRRLLKLMVPGVLSAGALQINLLVGTIIASLQAGAVSYLYFADRVYQFPLGVIGIAIGTALLPNLSRMLARDGGAAMDVHNRAIEVSMLLTLPAAAALMVIPGPVVTVMFQYGRFTADDAAATAAALSAFAAGLPAYVLIRVLTPGFFAREDTVTPVKFAAASVTANIVLSLALVWPFAHVGIAVATAAAAWLNVGLLWVALRRRGFLVIDAGLGRRLPRIAGAAAAMAILVWPAAEWLAEPLAGPVAGRITAMAALVVGGVVVFAILVLASRAASLAELRALMRRTAD